MKRPLAVAKGSVAVVIAARNAERTIGAAVRSALASSLVTEVIVVSDGSTDATASAATEVAVGDGRLRVLTLEQNVGPAEARNRAIDLARSDFLALLDADDEFLPGRLERLVAQRDWDLIADNIVFVSEPAVPPLQSPLDPTGTTTFERLSLTEFVRGNLSRHGRPRSEYGFLKPVISRSFLLRTGLRYDSRLRLGEDYDFYLRALMAGGRFLLTYRVGYLAHVRPDSLSARHRTEDLQTLAYAMRAHLETEGISEDDRGAMLAVLRGIERRYALRTVLDAKAEHGLIGAFRSLVARPDWIRTVVADVFRDKIPAVQARAGRDGGHCLLSKVDRY